MNDARSLSPKKQQALRRKAVRLAKDSGLSQKQIAEQLGVHRGTVCRWIKIRKESRTALTSRKRGPGKKCKRQLSANKELKIALTMVRNTPNQINLVDPLWSRGLVQLLIFRKFKIKLSVKTVALYLARWGMASNSPHMLEGLKEGFYSGLKMQAKKKKAAILYLDILAIPDLKTLLVEDGKSSPNTVREQDWEEAKIILVRNSQGKYTFQLFQTDSVIKPDIMIKFMEMLIEDAGRKIILLEGGIPEFDNKYVQNWVRKNDDKIEVKDVSGLVSE